MKNRFKKRILLFAMLFAMLMVLTACDSQIDMYTYSDGVYDYMVVAFSIDSTTESMLNSYASSAQAAKHQYNQSGADGLPSWAQGSSWTISQYVRMYMSTLGYEYEGVEKDISSNNMAFTKKSEPSSSNTQTVDPNYSRKIERGPFIITVTETMSNPLNGTRESFNSARASTDANNPFYAFWHGYSVESVFKDNAQGFDLAGLQANGWKIKEVANVGGVIEYTMTRVIIPSFESVFPNIYGQNMFTPDNLMLNYIIVSNSSFQTDGGSVYVDEYGNKYYLFNRTFGIIDDANVINIKYIRPNTTGWYLVIIAIGAIVVVFIILRHRKKAPQPEQEKRLIFPYDPKYIYSNKTQNLPTQQSNNPFGDDYESSNNPFGNDYEKH